MADQELSLINTVELKIALADTDAKLQSSLDLYLCPLLLKLASKHGAVRQQILKFIQDIIPRFNSAYSVKLPVLKLINQAKAPNLPVGVIDGTTVQLYSLLFVSKGIDRLTADERKALVPIIITDIHKFHDTTGARLFYALVKLLKDWKTPDRGTTEFDLLRKELDIAKEDELYIIDKFEKLLLLNPVTNNDGVIPRGYTCPGLSANDVRFLTYDAGVSYKGDDLSNVKVNITSFASIIHDENIITFLLIAAVDSNEKVGNSAAALLRKVTIPYEDEPLINHIISLYAGDKNIPRSPVKPQVQERFLAVLNNSKIATVNPAVPIITSIGLNSTKFPRLKSSTIQFIQWIARNGGDSLISDEYAVSVASQLRNNLHSQGWPKFEVVPGANYSNEVKQRRLQYEALGDILKKDSNMLQDLSYIEFLFDSLLGDILEVRSTIQEALGSLVIHLPTLSVEAKARLKSILKSYLQNEDFAHGQAEAIQSARFTALKYLNTAFPFSDSESRLLNILGTSSKNRTDVIEEAQKGLHPYWFNILQSTNTKEFKSTSELLGTGNYVEFPSFSSFMEELMKATKYSSTRDSASLRYSLTTAVEFGLQVIVTQAVKDKSTVIVQDQEWTTRLEKGLEHDNQVINLTKEELSKTFGLNDFFGLLLNEVSQITDRSPISHDPSTVFGKVFLKLLSLSPQDQIGNLVKDLQKVISIITTTKVLKDEDIYNAANAIGIIGSHQFNDGPSINSLFNESLEFISASGLKNLQSQNRVLALGFLTSRLLLRGRESEIDESSLVQLYDILVEGLNSTDSTLSNISIFSISELSKFGGFGPVMNSPKIQDYKAKIFEILKLKIKKLNEKAIIAGALLSLSEEESSSDEFTEFESAIYETHNTKQVEQLFTSGEAFSILGSGWDSKFLKQKIDVQSPDISLRVSKRTNRTEFILKKILEAASSSKPSLRRAGCIWLLSFVQYSGDSVIVSDYSNTIHLTFMKFLADRDQLVQESASRGLSLIYDLGNPDLKESLVKSLLKSFTETTTSSKLTSGSVSHDTELFEPGVLKTDDGSVSTYKDILGLASEIGDPSLVYKFMSLAKSSALWSSRKGIAFGLGNIMSKSSLDKLLFENESLSKRLIPKLFRYRFDPIPSVSKSMNDIWGTIVSDSSKTIDVYYKEILKELLDGMGHKEWRVREASTVALTDLLQTLTVDKYQNEMEEIWTMGFRTIDDIKESVRKAGGGLTRSLSQTLVNSINVESGSSEVRANEVLTTLLPFLLGNKGILSDAEDVRNFSLETILKLIKKAGKAIKPFIAELIDQFVLLMSTLEPQVINYLALNADKYKLKHEDIDAQRIQSVGSSPMMSALEKLVDLIDESNIEDVVTTLQSSVKKSVGLPSKAAASKIIVTLVLRHIQIVKPYADTLLKICTSQLKDRNNTVSSSFATAAGYVCRVAKTESVVNYSTKIEQYYFESEDDKTRIVAAIASEALSKYSGDTFASVASAFLPVAFIGKNDPVKEVSSPFTREWTENTSGNAAIKLYLQEIVELVRRTINSQQFLIRQVSAKSIAEACSSLDGSTGLAEKVAEELFEVLLSASQGRSWSGKEDILAALVSLSIQSDFYVKTHPDLLSRINKTVITEAKRRNKSYQKKAIVSLGTFLNKYPNEEIYNQLIEVFQGILCEEYYESEDEDEEESNIKGAETVNLKSTKKNLTREADRINALSSLTTSFQIYEDGSFHSELLEFIVQSLLITFEPNVYIPTWRSQLAVVEGLTKVANALKTAKVLSSENWKLLKESFTSSLRHNTRNEDVENVKLQTVRFGKALISIDNADLTDFIKLELLEYKEREQSPILKVEIENATT